MTLEMRSPTDWITRAQCCDMDPNDFDPPHHINDNDIERRWDYAAGLCSGCPVIAECARDALEQHDGEIIRAGVPLPQPRGNASYKRAAAALRLIARGTPLPIVTARAVSTPVSRFDGGLP